MDGTDEEGAVASEDLWGKESHRSILTLPLWSLFTGDVFIL